MLDRVKVFFSRWSFPPVLEWIRGSSDSFDGSGEDELEVLSEVAAEPAA